jgi:threonine dehydrogenase-like Zn-dependent dehydrogenase
MDQGSDRSPGQGRGPEFHKREATLLSTRNATRVDFLHVVDLLKNGSVKAKPFVTHRVDFTNLAAEFPKWIEPDNDVIKAIVDV